MAISGQMLRSRVSSGRGLSLDRLAVHRKLDFETRATAELGTHVDRAVMHRDQFALEMKPDPGAGDALRGAGAEEASEDLADLAGRNADTAIAYAHAQRAGATQDVDHDLALGLREFDRVRDEIGEDLIEKQRITAQQDRRRRRVHDHAEIPCQPLEALRDRADQGAAIETNARCWAITALVCASVSSSAVCCARRCITSSSTAMKRSTSPAPLRIGTQSIAHQ